MILSLESLTLNGEPIDFSRASLDWKREGLIAHWTGFVWGGGT